MKRLLLPLLAALALPTAVNAGVDPEVHNLCKDVSDYMGCVKANKNYKTKIINTGKIYGFRYWQNPGEDRLFIVDVLKGSVSDKEDLRIFDEIIQINNKDISSMKGYEVNDNFTEEINKPIIKLKVKRFFKIENRKKPGHIILEKKLVKSDMEIKSFDWEKFKNLDMQKAKESAYKWNKFVKYLYPRGSRSKTFRLSEIPGESSNIKKFSGGGSAGGFQTNYPGISGSELNQQINNYNRTGSFYQESTIQNWESF